MTQEESIAIARSLFGKSFPDIDRLLSIFDNSLVQRRHFAMPIEWYSQPHSLQERNDLFIKLATEYGIEAINACLSSSEFLAGDVPSEEIDAIFFVSTTGMATPSIEARIMNRMSFSPRTRRIPIWGLGCAGGVAGIALADAYCQANPRAKVILIALELCSLTFQLSDLSKSNLVGVSLFADGVTCVLVAGEESKIPLSAGHPYRPKIRSSRTTLMPNSEGIMGWDVKDDGLYVVFSRNIPVVIRGWLKDNIEEYLTSEDLSLGDIRHFVAHPGGRKILEAYQDSLNIPEAMTRISRAVLAEHGNMSSPSVVYVLREFMLESIGQGEIGLMTALGPGFSSELLLLEWQ